MYYIYCIIQYCMTLTYSSCRPILQTILHSRSTYEGHSIIKGTNNCRGKTVNLVSMTISLLFIVMLNNINTLVPSLNKLFYAC